MIKKGPGLIRRIEIRLSVIFHLMPSFLTSFQWCFLKQKWDFKIGWTHILLYTRFPNKLCKEIQRKIRNLRTAKNIEKFVYFRSKKYGSLQFDEIFDKKFARIFTKTCWDSFSGFGKVSCALFKISIIFFGVMHHAWNISAFECILTGAASFLKATKGYMLSWHFPSLPYSRFTVSNIWTVVLMVIFHCVMFFLELSFLCRLR